MGELILNQYSIIPIVSEANQVNFYLCLFVSICG